MKFTDFIKNSREYEDLYESRSCRNCDVNEEDYDEDYEDGMGDDVPCDKLLNPEKYIKLAEASDRCYGCVDEEDEDFGGRDYEDDEDDDYDDEDDYDDDEDDEDYEDYDDEDDDYDDEDDEDDEDDDDEDYDDEDDEDDDDVGGDSVNEEIRRSVYRNVSYRNLNESDRRHVDHVLRSVLK